MGKDEEGTRDGWGDERLMEKSGLPYRLRARGPMNPGIEGSQPQCSEVKNTVDGGRGAALAAVRRGAQCRRCQC